jgi:hypothetical protein
MMIDHTTLYMRKIGKKGGKIGGLSRSPAKISAVMANLIKAQRVRIQNSVKRQQEERKAGQ